MANNISGMPVRGKTYHGGTPATIAQSAGLEGAPVSFADTYRDGAGTLKKRSNVYIEAVLVRNTSGIYLTPGRTVKWQTGYRGRRVDGYTSTTGGEVAGVVDDQLPAAGVAPNDLFWLLRRGPVLVKTSAAGLGYAVDDVLVALTAASSQAEAAGRPGILDQANTANAARSVVNAFGRVMSAMTTAQTNANMLVHLTLL